MSRNGLRRIGAHCRRHHVTNRMRRACVRPTTSGGSSGSPTLAPGRTFSSPSGWYRIRNDATPALKAASTYGSSCHFLPRSLARNSARRQMASRRFLVSILLAALGAYNAPQDLPDLGAQPLVRCPASFLAAQAGAEAAQLLCAPLGFPTADVPFFFRLIKDLSPTEGRDGKGTICHVIDRWQKK